MPRDHDLIGTVLGGRYELRSLLGEGAFGRVYLGMDRRLARIVAVKVIKPTRTQDPEWVRSFLGEARLLARVSDPGIVQIFDVGHAAEGPYYVAEFIDGESLASRLRHGPLEPRAAWEIAEQLCRALAHAHEQLIVHRDIKPANILISAKERVKVGDFGVARIAESATEVPSTAVLGTPRYMAPEQARGQRTTPASDVYSIGVVLYQMLAGRTPFDGANAAELAAAHENDTPPPLPGLVPDALARVVTRALAKDPADRYGDARALARALARARPASGTNRRRGAAASAPDSSTTVISAGAFSGTGERKRTEAQHAPTAGTAALATALRRPSALLTPTPTPARSRPGSHRPPPAIGGRPRRPTDVDDTRIAPERPQDHDPTPNARRPSRLALALLAAGLIAAAVLGVRALTAPALVRVPDLRGLHVPALLADARRAGLQPVLKRRYGATPIGAAFSQRPAPGARIDSGASVVVLISKGAPPVEVPRLVGSTEAQARAILGSLHLRTSVTAVPAPGTAPGTVTGQSQTAGSYVPSQGTISLQVAEVPQWRTVVSFAGTDAGASVPFRIQGRRWRALYSMSYAGTCTFILFCEGPTANVLEAASGRAVNQFGLGEGSDQTQVFTTGPGLYQIKLAPGMDSAQWSIDVQDYY